MLFVMYCRIVSQSMRGGAHARAEERECAPEGGRSAGEGAEGAAQAGAREALHCGRHRRLQARARRGAAPGRGVASCRAR